MNAPRALPCIFTMDFASSFQHLGITGNVYLDGILLAHIVPLVVMYARQLADLFQQLFLWILATVAHAVTSRFNSRVVGTVVCNANVYEHDPLFEALHSAVFASKTFKDNTLHSKYGELVDKEVDEEPPVLKNKWAWLYRQQEFSDTIMLRAQKDDPLIINSGRKSHNLIRSALYVCPGESVKLLFTFTRVNVVKREAKEDDAKVSNGRAIDYQDFIKLRVRAFGDEGMIANNDYMQTQIKAYLYNELGIIHQIKYVYQVTGSSVLFADKLRKFLRGHWLSADNGTLNYGDPSDLGFASAPSDSSNTFQIVLDEKAVQNDSDNSRHVHWAPIQPTQRKTRNQPTYRYWMNYCTHLTTDGQCGVARLDGVVLFMIGSQDGRFGIGLISEGRVLSSDDVKALVNRVINDVFKSTKTGNVADDVRTARKLYHYHQGNWERMTMDPRTLDTLYLHPDVHRTLTRSLDTFLKLKELYERIHLTYKTGILLYGPPGTGKTSTIRTLAHMYQMDVYMLDVNDPKINDTNIAHILNQLASNTSAKILVMEDVDSAFADKGQMSAEARTDQGERYNADTQKVDKTERQSYLTYSGLLQAMDGLNSHQTGVIFFMTTNHVEKLGDALIREGRIDHRVYMGPCCHIQIVRMVETIVGRYLEMEGKPQADLHDRAVALATRLCHGGRVAHTDGTPVVPADTDESPVKPCALQTYILSHILDLDHLFDHCTDLLAGGTETYYAHASRE